MRSYEGDRDSKPSKSCYLVFKGYSNNNIHYDGVNGTYKLMKNTYCPFNLIIRIYWKQTMRDKRHGNDIERNHNHTLTSLLVLLFNDLTRITATKSGYYFKNEFSKVSAVHNLYL